MLPCLKFRTQNDFNGWNDELYPGFVLCVRCDFIMYSPICFHRSSNSGSLFDQSTLTDDSVIGDDPVEIHPRLKGSDVQ